MDMEGHAIVMARHGRTRPAVSYHDYSASWHHDSVSYHHDGMSWQRDSAQSRAQRRAGGHPMGWQLIT
jgi:hypothetical protein